MKMAYLEWLDASYQRGELREDEFETHVVLKSCGFLIKETDTTVSIAFDYWPKDNLWSHVQHIPKSLIVCRKEVDI